MHNVQPLLKKTYLKAVTAKGVYIYDESGKAYLDGSSGAVTCSLGHSHERLLPIIKKQLDKLQFVYRLQFASEEAERLATKLFELSPGRSLAHTFFVNSGTEAVETAMKIAVQYWQEKGQPGKRHFISRWKSYHGITLGALSLSGHALRRKRFEPMLMQHPFLYADLENHSVETQVEEFERVIETTGASTIAAFIAEPIVGAAGTAIAPPPAYYEKFRTVCNHYEILFIADEVMTGLGRTGTWFGLDHWQARADIVAVGKSLGAGYAPIAATLMTENILDPIKNGSGLIMSGHTYSGHPLSCATALNVLEIVEEERLLENVLEKGAYLKSALLELQKSFSFIQHVRGKGLLLGMEFDPAVQGVQAKLIERCFQNRLLVYPAMGGKEGRDENGVLISPPFIITAAQADELLEKLTRSLKGL